MNQFLANCIFVYIERIVLGAEPNPTQNYLLAWRDLKSRSIARKTVRTEIGTPRSRVNPAGQSRNKITPYLMRRSNVSANLVPLLWVGSVLMMKF